MSRTQHSSSKRTHRRRGRPSSAKGLSSPAVSIGSGGESGGEEEYDFEMVDSLEEDTTEVSIEPESSLSEPKEDDHKSGSIVSKDDIDDPVVLGSEMTMLTEWAVLQKSVNDKLDSLDQEHTRVAQLSTELAKLRESLHQERNELIQARQQHEKAVQDLTREKKSVIQMKHELEKERQTMAEEMTKIRNERKTLRRDCKRATELSESLSTKVNDLATLVDTGTSEVSSMRELAKSVVSGATAKARVHLTAMKKEQSKMQAALMEEYKRSRRIGMFCCKKCSEPIARETDIESRCYQVGQGAFTEAKRGYLFTGAVSLTQGPSKTEKFTTGEYSISWVSCAGCSHTMGWKYLSAQSKSNSNKVGKYCLARASLTSPKDRADDELECLSKAATMTAIARSGGGCGGGIRTTASAAISDDVCTTASESEMDESAMMRKERKSSLSVSSMSEDRGLEMAHLVADDDMITGLI